MPPPASTMHAAALLPLLLAAAGSISLGPLRFVYWPGGEPLARHMAALSGRFSALPGLPPDVLYGPHPIEIDLAPDAVRWDSLTGGRVPSWGAGVAVPGEDRIVLPAFGKGEPLELGATLRHELAHMALHRYLRGAALPRWFDEGYATYASNGMDANAAWMLRLAFLLHRAPPLDSLELEWPAGEAEARVAYLLSASAVALLAERTGDNGMRLLFLRWRETGSLDLAMRRAFGITFGQFEREWRQEVSRRYGWPVLLSDTLIFWLISAPLLVILLVIRRRRDRERLARLKAGEPPDRPAWWLEESSEPAGQVGPEPLPEPGTAPGTDRADPESPDPTAPL